MSEDFRKDFPWEEECKRILQGMSHANKERVFSYEGCELEYDFLGFLDSYKDLSEKLPKDFTIIDIGACQAVQSEYFKDFAGYIAVEPFVPESAMCKQLNMDAFEMTGQEFIEDILPRLQEAGIDPNKTFCICSYVPDVPLRNELIPETFPFYRSIYTSELHERLPEPELGKDNPKFVALVEMLNEAADKGILHRDPEKSENVLVYMQGMNPEEYGVTEGFVSVGVRDMAQKMKNSLRQFDNKSFMGLKEAMKAAGYEPKFTKGGDYEGLHRTKEKHTHERGDD